MKAGEGKNQSLLEEGGESESKDMMGIIPNYLGLLGIYYNWSFVLGLDVCV